MDYLTLVKEKEEENRALDARMRVDTDILYLKKYVMTDAQNKAVPDIINLTLNRPAVFAANVISSLEKTSQQTTVESNNRAIDTHKIEAFQDAAFNSANARLQKQPGFASLNSFADIQLCIRGRTARRVLFRIEDGVLIPDIMPWDGRYTFYESGLDGLAWAAYKTTRSKAKIEAEYDKVTVQGKEASV